MKSLHNKDARALRVAIFEPFGNFYGSERSMLDLLSALPPGAVRPVVYCPKNAPWLGELQKRGVSCVDSFERDLHTKSRARRITALLRFLSFLISNRIELVHVNQFGALPYALKAARLLRLPVVLHSRWHEDPQSLALMKQIPRELASIVCISDYQRSLIDSSGFSGVRLHVIHNPYHLTKMMQPEAEGGDPHFLCPARLHPHKRQDVLIRACALYSARYGPCKVTFFGHQEQGSGYEQELRSLVRWLGIEAQVTFAGYRADWVEQARHAAAMVIPSDTEALGRVVFEAWDGGTIPIAWMGSGGPAETIRASGAGLLYLEQSPEALAEAMQRAATLSLSERTELVKQGISWVRKSCAPDEHARRIMSVWRGNRPTRANDT